MRLFANHSAIFALIAALVCVPAAAAPAKKGPCGRGYERAGGRGASESGVVFGYWAPGAKTANPALIRFWSERFGARFENLGKGTEVATLHFSTNDLATDAVLSLSRPGDNVEVIGLDIPIARAQRVLQRNVNNGKAPSLVLVSEAALKAESADPAAGLERLIARVGPNVPVVVVRQGDSRSPTLLSSRHPLVMETLNIDGRNLTTPLTATCGHPQLIAKLNQAAAYRNHWLPDRYQVELANMLGREPALRHGPVDPIDASRALPPLPQTIPERTFMTSLGSLDGFLGRDRQQTLDLGIGQPHIRLSDRAREREAENPPATKEKARDELETEVRKYYAANYRAPLSDAAVTPTAGVSSAILQVMERLPEGSTILIPEFSYSGIQRSAELLGLKVKTYSPRDESLLNTAIDDSVKLVVTNFPHNPSGKIMSEAMRAKLHGLARDGVLVFNDLSYTRFTFDGNPVSSLLTGAASSHNLIEAFSASKDFGLPETRVAALVGDPRVVERVRAGPLHDGADISALRLHAFTRVLREPGLTLTKPEELQARRDNLISALQSIGWPASAIVRPEAGLNVMVELPRGIEPEDFMRWLWRETGVFVAPDTWFGTASGHQRFVRFALSEDAARISGLATRLKAAGIGYANLKEAIVLSGLRASAATRGISWPSQTLGAPERFASPEAARRFMEKLYGEPAILDEVRRVTEGLGGANEGALWDRYFEVYDKLVLYDPNYLKLMAKASGHLRADGVTLDLGSGTGNFSLHAALDSPQRRVVGSDISAHGVALSQQKATAFASPAARRNLSFAVTDGTALPVGSGSVDNALLINSFYAFPDKPAALRRVRDTLKPGGTIFLHDFFPTEKKPVDEAMVQRQFAALIENAVRNGASLTQHDAAFLYYMNRERILRSVGSLVTPAEFRRMAEDAGLEIVSIEPSGYLGGSSVVLRRR